MCLATIIYQQVLQNFQVLQDLHGLLLLLASKPSQTISRKQNSRVLLTKLSLTASGKQNAMVLLTKQSLAASGNQNSGVLLTKLSQLIQIVYNGIVACTLVAYHCCQTQKAAIMCLASALPLLPDPKTAQNVSGTYLIPASPTKFLGFVGLAWLTVVACL